LTGSIVALVLFAASSEAIPDAAEHSPPFDIDPCAGVDAEAVRDLVELELRGSPARQLDVPISVSVRCVDGAQEIRVEPWASRGDDGIRSIALPAAADGDPAAQEARSRELALAIAELVRRLEITRPLAPAPPPPPPAPPVVVTSPPPPSDAPSGSLGLAVLSSFETFTGGQKLAGGDICLAAPIGRFGLGELRIGGRVLIGDTLPAAGLTARAATAAVAAGVNVSSPRRRLGYALMLRAQGYAIDYRLEPAVDGGSRTARLGALIAVLEPRVVAAVTSRISVAAAVAAGVPIHGIVVRSQGAASDSLTGFVLSAHLGAMVTF
jgi:hypothetical protein